MSLPLQILPVGCLTYQSPRWQLLREEGKLIFLTDRREATLLTSKLLRNTVLVSEKSKSYAKLQLLLPLVFKRY